MDPKPPREEEGDWIEPECPDHCEDKAPLGEFYHCPFCDAEWFPDDEIAALSPTPKTGDEHE
jgi:hypothetical protein